MRRAALLGLTLVLASSPAAAQDANFGSLPIDTIEARLRSAPLNILRAVGARAEGDRTMAVTIAYDDGTVMNAKLAKAWRGASHFNNEPRYELAAYEIQKLFLGPDEYVVPPTVLRLMVTEELREHDRGAEPTFDGSDFTTLVLLQYWLMQVTDENVWDRDRLEKDTVYARHAANLNILTYLIRHNDSNEGNILISEFDSNPRLFSVDNGLSFRSMASDRGYDFRRMRVKRLPHATVERLRAITPEQLDALGVLAQFEVEGMFYRPAPIGANLDPDEGVYDKDGIVQMGLTAREIRDLKGRLEDLLEDIDKGDYAIF